MKNTSVTHYCNRLTPLISSKKRVVNNGIVPQYYVENSHEPIIPREIFMQVQEEMVRRANLRTGKNGKSVSTVASTPFRVLFIVAVAEKFTGEFIGTTVDISPLSGDVLADLKKKVQIVQAQQ